MNFQRSLPSKVPTPAKAKLDKRIKKLEKDEKLQMGMIRKLNKPNE